MDGAAWRRRSPSRPSDIERIWDGLLIAAVVVGVLVIGLIVFVVIRFRRRDDRAAAPAAREHPDRGDLHGRAAAHRRRPVRRSRSSSVRVDRRRGRRPRPHRRRHRLPVAVAVRLPRHRASRVIGTDDVEPELVLPAGTKVQFDLTSVDVIHSFWIPGFRFKRDMFPGQTQTFQVDVGDRTGSWPEHRRVRRVLRARPPQDAVLGPHRHPGRVPVLAPGGPPMTTTRRSPGRRRARASTT